MNSSKVVMPYKVETPIKTRHVGCFVCSRTRETHSPETSICVGFGDAYLEKDGEIIWSESDVINPTCWEDFMTCAQAEELALKTAEADWRIHLVGPLKDTHYQRQGDGRWVLYEEGKGFA